MLHDEAEAEITSLMLILWWKTHVSRPQECSAERRGRKKKKEKKVNVYGVSNEIAKSQVHLHTKSARGQRSEELKMMRERETMLFLSRVAQRTNRNERLVHVCSSHSASISLWITFGRKREWERKNREKKKTSNFLLRRPMKPSLCLWWYKFPRESRYSASRQGNCK